MLRIGYAGIAAFFGWMYYTDPQAMAVIAKATGHMLAQFGQLALVAFLCAAAGALIINLGLIYTGGKRNDSDRSNKETE